MDSLSYGRLVIGTGAVPIRPEIEGRDLPGVYELHTMEDSFKVKKHLQQSGVKSAIIIGAGYIGVEMADALSHLSMKVTLVGRSRVVFPSVDAAFGAVIGETLTKHGVEVINGTEVARIESTTSGLLLTAKKRSGCHRVYTPPYTKRRETGRFRLSLVGWHLVGYTRFYDAYQLMNDTFRLAQTPSGGNRLRNGSSQCRWGGSVN